MWLKLTIVMRKRTVINQSCEFLISGFRDSFVCSVSGPRVIEFKIEKDKN